MKLLITGSSGFIGSHLLQAACKKFGKDNVIVLSSKENEVCDYVLYDSNYNIKDEDKIKISGADVILHAGAYIPKSRMEKNTLHRCTGNIVFTDLLLSLDFKSLKKVVYISTVDVYKNEDVITESSPIEPESLYGLSKLYSEKMVTQFCNEKGVICQILRVGHVYGPGEKLYEKIIPTLIRNMLNGRGVELWGDGSELRSFIYIEDVIEAIMASIKFNEDLGVINIVSSQSISIVELIGMLRSLIDCNIDLIYKRYQGEKRNLCYDNTKMLEYLLKKETDLESGLLSEINYFKDECEYHI
jgi:UDP-glucose 4-epimerase